MKFLKSCLIACSALAFSAVAAPQVTPDANGADAALSQALKGSWRDPANAARDQYRHPRETLEFFGLTPSMTVVQLWPGSGWYTEVLAPVLREHGQLIDAAVPPKGFGESDGTVRYLEKLKANPTVYGKVKTIDFAPPQKTDLGPEGSADMVLTFRNLHNWQGDGQLDAVFAAAFKVLKHGGVFGVEDLQDRLHAGGLCDRRGREGGFQTRGPIRGECEPQGHQGLPEGRVDPATHLHLGR
jgi:predicted methyltransferase